MRILEVNALFPPERWGGAEVYVYNLSRALVEKGHVVQVVAGRKRPDPIGDPPQKTHVDGLPVVRMPAFLAPLSNQDAGIEQAFADVLEAFAPDVVHFHNFFLHLPVSLLEIAQASGLPVVQHLHDYWFMCPAGTLTVAPDTVCGGPDGGRRCAACAGTAFARHKLCQRKRDKGFHRSIGRRLPHPLKAVVPHSVKRVVKSWWARGGSGPSPSNRTDVEAHVLRYFQDRDATFRTQLDRCDRLLFPSRFVREAYADWGLEEERLTVFPLGLDLSRFEGFRRLPSDAFRFGYVGSLSEHKGVDTLVRAFRRLERSDVALNLWGRGAPAFCERLNELVDGDERIQLCGSLPNAEIAEAYRRMDVLVMPSRCPETYGLVIREAFATGTPVIASDIGALSEAVDHGRDGLLAEPGSVRQLAERMATVCGDRALYRAMQSQVPPAKSIREDAAQTASLFEALVPGETC